MNYKLSTKHVKKRAFITGSASGLGLALCKELAKDGWLIGMTDIDELKLVTAVEEVEALGGKTISYKQDVRDRERYKEIMLDFVNQNGGIDLLINNAGIGESGPFDEFSLERWDQVVGVNQMGVIYGCFLAVPYMKKQRSGHIITISSAASYANAPGMSAYSATKAAVYSLSDVLYCELKAFGVDVSVVTPTFFKTNIIANSKSNEEEKKIGQLLLDTSGIEADEVAQAILTRAGKGAFQIYYPKIAARMHWIKRMFPRFFMSQKIKQASKRDAFVARLKKKKAKQGN